MNIDFRPFSLYAEENSITYSCGIFLENNYKNGMDHYFPSEHSDSCLDSCSMVLLKLLSEGSVLKTSFGSAGNKQRHKLGVLVFSSSVLATQA